MTQALTYALLLAFFRNEMGFGGNNGLTDFKEILGFNLQADSTRVALFMITAILLAVIFVVSQKSYPLDSARWCWRFVTRNLAHALLAIEPTVTRCGCLSIRR